ncbi:hypothetical protein BBD39_05530 [Arsenophonus endosymbiont of Bemisia tabaci Asia II 3]|nr:hypothetical protein BBD39_05530 [Arsenophonus endosymbiont of Bemisia tabaci Asia II 3]
MILSDKYRCSAPANSPKVTAFPFSPAFVGYIAEMWGIIAQQKQETPLASMTVFSRSGLKAAQLRELQQPTTHQLRLAPVCTAFLLRPTPRMLLAHLHMEVFGFDNEETPPTSLP